MRIPSLVLGEYSDLRSQDFNYGNDGCDGFAPNFPLIRTKRNQTANKYSINDITHHYAEIIIPQKFDFVNGFEKNGTIPYKN